MPTDSQNTSFDFVAPIRRYNRSQKLLRQTRKTASYLKSQAIENSFKRAYVEVEDNIIIYIERLKT